MFYRLDASDGNKTKTLKQRPIPRL